MKKFTVKLTTVLLPFLIYSCSKNNDSDKQNNCKVVVRDFDSHAPVAGAKVYLSNFIGQNYILVDSFNTDTYGETSFWEDPAKIAYHVTHARKEGLLSPRYLRIRDYELSNGLWIDTLDLFRPSYLSLNLNNNNNLSIGDEIVIMAKNHYNAALPASLFGTFTQIYRGTHSAPDTTINLYTTYIYPVYAKIFFLTEIFRNGALISSQQDSASLVQFSTVNFQINY